MEMVGMRDCPVPAWHGTATPCSATNCFHFLDAQTQHLHLHSVTFLYARKDQLETPRSPLSSQKCCLTKILIVFGHPCRTAAAPLFTVIIRSFNTNITAYCYGNVNTPFAKLAAKLSSKVSVTAALLWEPLMQTRPVLTGTAGAVWGAGRGGRAARPHPGLYHATNEPIT